jgi:hypothetical protein
MGLKGLLEVPLNYNRVQLPFNIPLLAPDDDFEVLVGGRYKEGSAEFDGVDALFRAKSIVE